MSRQKRRGEGRRPPRSDWTTGQAMEAKRRRRLGARIERQREFRRALRMRRARRMGTAAALVVVAVVLGMFLVRSGSTGVGFAGDVRTGGTLTSLRLPELEGSGSIDYSQFQDKPLVLNFFASWCPNCIAEMPDFQQVHERLGDQVAFLGVSQSDSRAASIELARQTGVRYPLAIDARGAFFQTTGSVGMPTTLFIRPGGEIAFVQVGALDAGSLRSAIQQYLGV